MSTIGALLSDARFLVKTMLHGVPEPSQKDKEAEVWRRLAAEVTDHGPRFDEDIHPFFRVEAIKNRWKLDRAWAVLGAFAKKPLPEYLRSLDDALKRATCPHRYAGGLRMYLGPEDITSRDEKYREDTYRKYELDRVKCDRCGDTVYVHLRIETLVHWKAEKKSSEVAK